MQKIFHKNNKRILVIGANFAGLTLCQNIKQNYSVTVIDPNPYFEYLPGIHELISNFKRSYHLRLSRSKLIKNLNQQYLQDKVIKINPENNQVITQNGLKINYDVCIVTIGGMNNTFNIDGVNEFTFPFKSVVDCELIGTKIKQLIDIGNKSIVIVGGGLEGVEALGEILRYDVIQSKLEIHIIEKNNHLLPNQSKTIDQNIRKLCNNYPIYFHTNAQISALNNKQITLSSGEKIESDLTIWTGGVKPSPILIESGLSKKEFGWAPVYNSLQSQYYDNIFIAGDASDLINPVIKQAYHAIDMGKCVAKNVQLYLKGKTLIEFKAKKYPTLISFGKLNSYMIYDNRVFAGTALSTLKEGVYHRTMLKFDPLRSFSSLLDFNIRSWRTASQYLFQFLESNLSSNPSNIKILN